MEERTDLIKTHSPCEQQGLTFPPAKPSLNLLNHPIPKVTALMTPTNRQTQVNKWRTHYITLKDICKTPKRTMTQPRSANPTFHKINPKPRGKFKALQNRLNIENAFGVNFTEKQGIINVL